MPEPTFDSLADCLDWVEPRLLEAHQNKLERGQPAEMPTDMPWWPAGYAHDAEARAFEIAVGAVLTQNTNWNNVEKALANLHAAEVLAADRILALDDETLSDLIRPSGFFRIKTRRLRAMTEAWQDAGGRVGLQARPTNELREWLLGIHGVGHETADDILLYALERPVWVIDTYTRRLFHRLGFPETATKKYDRLADDLLTHTLEPTAPRLARWHGLIVEHAKAHCRVKPVCGDCPLIERCAYGSGLEKGE
ncbi:endonuclease [Guyparkeria hydrothermalis]|uniref:endonuclease III domain-containing protein n=2 Tax=Guyparkeria TaxID=2035712 RepID=UPI0010AB586E|nr:endonuclease [Guyparkeria sp. SB14A]MCL7751581.1 endonuclease [Guyparkeria hydrothermalis]TKA90481.1 endonuclease [Guyparkeria sp. SB14A]